jgi:hypothetical protein
MYTETCSSIRTTDDISFKLMGIVPLLSGAALLTFFLKEQVPVGKPSVIVTLSLFAALVTLGLFRWELRNIQTCSWLRRRAETLESAVVAAAGVAKQPPPPMRIGKTEAEKWIYSVTVFAWLCIPIVESKFEAQSWLLGVYIVLAFLIAVVTVVSALRSVRVRPAPVTRQSG